MKDKDIKVQTFYRVNDIDNPAHGKGVGVVDIHPDIDHFDFLVCLEENENEKFYLRSDQLAPYFAEIPNSNNWEGYKVGDRVKVREIGSNYDGLSGYVSDIIDDEYLFMNLDHNGEKISINTNNICYESETKESDFTSMGTVGDVNWKIGSKGKEPNPVAIIDTVTLEHFRYTDDILMKIHEKDHHYYLIDEDGGLLHANIGISFNRVK